MNEDLEERLKYYRVSADVNHPVHPQICDEACQEIERLRREWKIQNKCIADQHDEIAKLKAINAELLAALEGYVGAVGICGDPTQYSSSFNAMLAAIEKAKQ